LKFLLLLLINLIFVSVLQLYSDIFLLYLSCTVLNTELTTFHPLLKGIGGRHIKYDPHSENYVIDPSLNLQIPVRDTVLCLCELGWLYTKVSSYIQSCEKAQVSRGLAVQAFSFALQEELHDYYRLLAVLEQELARKVLAKDTPPTTEASNDSSKWVESVDPKGTSGLTLLRLRAWMQEPMDRMCLMARLVDSASPLAGGTSHYRCLSVSHIVTLTVSVSPTVSVCVSLSVSFCLSVSVSINLFISVSLSVSICLSVSVHFSTGISIVLGACPPYSASKWLLVEPVSS
jgi:Gamma tubulin complex component N-terminal